jgi:hypothetical protein
MAFAEPATEALIDRRPSGWVDLVAVVLHFRLASPRIRIEVDDGGSGRAVSDRLRLGELSVGSVDPRHGRVPLPAVAGRLEIVARPVQDRV